MLKGVGISFVVLGIVEFFLSKNSCKALCSVCLPQELKPCYFILLFAGIIFIVSGIEIIKIKKNLYPKPTISKKSFKKTKK